MTYSNTDPFVPYTIAEGFIECIRPYLAGTTSGLPDRMCVHVGEVAWDDCECGQLIVSLLDSYESATFPAPWDGTVNGGTRKCGPPLYVLRYSVSMLRCAPGADGETPECSSLSAAARTAIEDAWAIRAGLQCCLCDATGAGPGKLFERSWLGPQVMIGPSGGCGGSELTVMVAIMNSGYPCDVS